MAFMLIREELCNLKIEGETSLRNSWLLVILIWCRQLPLSVHSRSDCDRILLNYQERGFHLFASEIG